MHHHKELKQETGRCRWASCSGYCSHPGRKYLEINLSVCVCLEHNNSLLFSSLPQLTLFPVVPGRTSELLFLLVLLLRCLISPFLPSPLCPRYDHLFCLRRQEGDLGWNDYWLFCVTLEGGVSEGCAWGERLLSLNRSVHVTLRRERRLYSHDPFAYMNPLSRRLNASFRKTSEMKDWGHGIYIYLSRMRFPIWWQFDVFCAVSDEDILLVLIRNNVAVKVWFFADD